MTCFCGGTLVPTRYNDEFFARPLLQCTACRMLKVEKAPTADELADFYRGAYSARRASYVGEAYRRVMRRRAVAQMAFIQRHIGVAGLEVLDYGCGFGVLLDTLMAAGARTSGFDYDERCLEALKNTPHTIVDEHVFDRRQEWDLVCLSHVVEHLRDPVTLLANLRNSTRRVFIEVPRYDSGRREQFVDLEGHLWFFTAPGVASLLERSGWEVAGITGAGPSLEYYWKGSALLQARRRCRRLLERDWFFNQYAREASDGMWIRLIAKPR